MEKSTFNFKEYICKQKCIPRRMIKWWSKSRARSTLAYAKVFFCDVNTKQYWDNIWAKEIAAPSKNRMYPNMYDAILNIVPENSLVLDIGCGMGILMKRLKEEKNCRVFGVDISRQAIDFVIKNNMAGVIAKVPPIPYPSKTFDVVVATELLEHLKNPHRAIQEILRVLKNNGTYIISVPENAGPAVNKEHCRSYDISRLKKIFDSGSIKIEMIKEDFESHKLLVVIGAKRY
ncbi:MAG: class I SAM-dependent methyltransferase [Candidatus Omnitrophica bacterium]|nr:class I SAM-dependent methyltransferase [Candidatus Omnitrophota bacterium]